MSSISPNPYPGLRPFSEKEANRFFGRKKQVADLHAILRRERFAAVIGTSGCGKSSLLSAGLIPSLRREMFRLPVLTFDGVFIGRAQESDIHDYATSGESEGQTTDYADDTRWNIAYLHPGDSPTKALAQALLDANALPQLADYDATRRLSFVDDSLRQTSLGLITLLRGAQRFSRGESPALLLVADQFEELFRFGQKAHDGVVQSPGETQGDFVQLLLRSSEDADIGPRVIVAMRSEFLADCVRFPGLAERINCCHYLVPRLNRDERCEAIARPAESVGVSMNAALVHRLADQFAENPDQLPILQHALHRAWDHLSQDGDGTWRLTNDSIKDVGGLTGALDKHGAEVLDIAANAGVDLANIKRVFQALTLTTSEGSTVRRPLATKQLQSVVNLSFAGLLATLKPFRADSCGFLVPNERENLTDETRIDICHESLIRQWKKLNEWATEETQHVRNWRHLEDLERKWDGKVALLVGPELKVYAEFFESDRVSLSWIKLISPTIDPVKTCHGVQRLLARSKQSASLRKWLIVVAALAIIYAVWTRYREIQHNAQRQEIIALAERRSALADRRSALADKKRKNSEILVYLVRANSDAASIKSEIGSELAQDRGFFADTDSPINSQIILLAKPR